MRIESSSSLVDSFEHHKKQKIYESLIKAIDIKWKIKDKIGISHRQQKIYEEALESEKELYYKPLPNPPLSGEGIEQDWDKNVASSLLKGETERGPEDHIKELSSDEWYLRYLSLEWLNWRYEYWLSKDIIFKLVQ